MRALTVSEPTSWWNRRASARIASGPGMVRSLSACLAEQIARFFAEWARPSLTILERTVNGQPGLVAQRDQAGEGGDRGLGFGSGAGAGRLAVGAARPRP